MTSVNNKTMKAITMKKAKITSETLKKWNACTDGFRRFCELFPKGADLKTAAEGLVVDGHSEWAIWLFERCREDDAYKEQAKDGFHNTGHSNTGHRNTGDSNTGDSNTGHSNTGHSNTGHRNTGDSNTGDSNTGHSNTGDSNTGHRNTGDSNTGHWNTGHSNTGYFNTITPEDILAFNKPCKRKDWDDASKPNLIYSLELTWWVGEGQMSDAEKAADPNFYMRGGQLRNRTYKEAWALAWENATEVDRNLIKSLPNFDAQVFFDISGIDLRNKQDGKAS